MPFKAIGGRATTFEIKIQKKKKLNVGINILDEGYPLYDEGIAQKDKRSKKK